MPNRASFLENVTHKLLWDFAIQKDHLISARPPDFMIIDKNMIPCKIGEFALSADHSKIDRKWKENKYLDLAW